MEICRSKLRENLHVVGGKVLWIREVKIGLVGGRVFAAMSRRGRHRLGHSDKLWPALYPNLKRKLVPSSYMCVGFCTQKHTQVYSQSSIRGVPEYPGSVGWAQYSHCTAPTSQHGTDSPTAEVHSQNSGINRILGEKKCWRGEIACPKWIFW